MESRRAVLPNAQSTEVVQPGHGPLHVPAVSPQPTAVRRPTPRDLRPDAAPAQPSAMRVGVKSPVSVQAIRTPPRTARLAAHRGDRVNQPDHWVDIGGVRGGRLRPQGYPARVGDPLVLAPLLSAVYWAGARLATPAPRPHEAAVAQSTSPVDRVRAVQLGQKQFVEFRPDTGLGPVAEPTPAGHATATAHLLGQILPVNAGLEHKQDTDQRLAILKRGTTRAVGTLGLGSRRQQRLDSYPKVVGQEGLGHGGTSQQGRSPRFPA